MQETAVGVKERTRALLPEEFADLEPFAADWAVHSNEAERYAKRLASSMEELQAFYDAALPRAVDAVKYLNGFELSQLPDTAQNLLHLMYSLIAISFAIECYQQPRVPDTGKAYLDLVVEPVP